MINLLAFILIFEVSYVINCYEFHLDYVLSGITNSTFESSSYIFSLMNLYLWKESHVYSKGKALVVSKVPLPDYRADLDERHGSTQKEVQVTA